MERLVKVEARVGLHARTAAQFVRTAAAAPMPVTVTKQDHRMECRPVDAKSILAVLGLDAKYGELITISADGDGAEQVLGELAAVVAETGE